MSDIVYVLLYNILYTLKIFYIGVTTIISKLCVLSTILHFHFNSEISAVFWLIRILQYVGYVKISCFQFFKVLSVGVGILHLSVIYWGTPWKFWEGCNGWYGEIDEYRRSTPGRHTGSFIRQQRREAEDEETLKELDSIR